jgi:hypothetical protein
MKINFTLPGNGLIKSVNNILKMIIIFWEMTPCGSYKNRRFGGSYRLHLQGVRVQTSKPQILQYFKDITMFESVLSDMQII